MIIADQATVKVHDCQQAVNAADKALIELRNSGVDEGNYMSYVLDNLTSYSAPDIIATAQAERHTAQVNLDAAYKNLIDLHARMPEKIKNVDDVEAEDSDLSDDEDAANLELEVSMTLDDIDDDDPDEDLDI